MKSLFNHQNLLIFFVALLLAAGCKGPETVVVNQSPTEMTPADTTVSATASNQASFRKLAIGEFNPIKTLDPLYADNAAAMRAVQLVYEGLVRFNADGSIVPGLAKDWSVSQDSLQYTFHLRTNIYYQDSQVFSTGTGRKMTSGDVKNDFERMTHADVPPQAAHMFMAIEDFEPYYLEQHYVYNPQNRRLKDISGIQTPNDSTVVFQLVNHDPKFIKKLATPYAVIYPREAVGNNLASFTPVGAGPFNFSQLASDSTLIFSKFQNYYDASDINLNRIDIITNTSESQLFRSMSEGNIYVLPQLGPQLFKSILSSNGSLISSYANRYNLKRPAGSTQYVLRYNPQSHLTLSEARKVASLIPSATDTGSYFNKFPDAYVTMQSQSDSLQEKSTISLVNNEIYAAYSDDPFVRTFLGNLAKTLIKYKTTFQMMDIRTPTRNTGLFVTEDQPLIPNQQWDSYQPLFRFSVKQVALQRSEIKGLEWNQYPWWFNPRGVTLPAEENLN
ncbi:MAG TPA: ABC transporter substrate-binding protein [Balneolaceae bacterium]|nr:ABC transporter substrate-binding protein [Balneolaceae bacterium]